MHINFKRFKFKFNNAAVIAFSIVFVMLLNVLCVLLEDKFPFLKLDLTENSITKITKETKSVLESLDESDVKIDIVYLKGENDVTEKVADVLKQYDVYSENVTYKVENFVTNPLVLSDYGIDPSVDVEGSVIVATENKEKVRIVMRDNMEMSYNQNTVFLLENLLTNAIGVVASDDRMNVRFVTGHNENPSEMLINLLNSQNVNTKEIDLSTEKLNSEIDLLFIMAPGSDYTMSEINAIDDYLNNGGNLAVALPFGVVHERLENYLSSWGVKANNDIILEQDKALSYQESGMYFYTTVTDSDAVKDLGNRILNSYARSLEYTKIGDIEEDLLLTTSNDSYSVPVMGSELDRENMKQGQYQLAYILEKPLGSFENTSKVIVTSSPSVWGVSENIVTDFDYHVYYSLSEESFSNAEFVMNMLSTVYGEVIQSIYVPIKSRKVSILSISEFTAKVLQRVFCVIIPLIVLLMGVVVWLKRRNK